MQNQTFVRYSSAQNLMLRKIRIVTFINSSRFYSLLRLEIRIKQAIYAIKIMFIHFKKLLDCARAQE